MHSSFLNRIRVLSAVLGVLIIFIILKLFFVQVIHNVKYTNLADHSYVTATDNIFDRGKIFFTEKTGALVAAADVLNGYKVEVNSIKIGDAQSLVETLAQYIPLDVADVTTRLTNPDGGTYRVIARHLTREQADAISPLELPGVTVVKDSWRVYPGNDLAGQTIGFVAYNNTILAGRYGLERFYDDVLDRHGDPVSINFFAEVFSDIRSTLFANTDGEGDVVTSIDPAIEDFVTRALSDAQKTWQAESAGAVVMDPKTGKIYALAAVPSFDPNNFQTVSDPNVFTNPLVERVYEFGSVIKPLIMAAGLDTGVVTKDTTYFDKGFVIVNNKQIDNFDKKGRGLATMQDVLNQSLNTGMVFVEQKLGRDTMRDYLTRYKVTEKTGIDLPGEVPALASNLKSNRDIEFATMAFGQGIAFTPIEAARAFSMLANGGHIVRPYVADRIEYTNGLSKTIDPVVDPTIVFKDPHTSENITNMLVTVADATMKTYGLSLPHYSMAAKTGTAQIANENGGGYYEDKHMHSIFGYFPAYDPKFLVFLYLKDPKGAKFAAQSLAPTLVDTAKFLVGYYNIPPDRP